MPKEAMVKL